MLINYIKIALRNLLRDRKYAIINIFGLGAWAWLRLLLLGMFVQQEWNYDRFHTDAENIYRMVWKGSNPHPRTPPPDGPTIGFGFSTGRKCR